MGCYRMIFVECNIIDLKTNQLKGKYHKTFDMQGDFNSWYKIVKTDFDTIINVMRYDYNENPGLKSVYDAQLLRLTRVSRELST